MQVGDETTTKILIAANLFHARERVAPDEKLALFCQSFTRLDKGQCLDLQKNTARDLLTEGLLASEKGEFSLTDKGNTRVKELMVLIDGAKSGLEKAVEKSLFQIAGGKQAGMFAQRLISMLKMLNQMAETEDLAPAAHTIEAVLALKMRELIEAPEQNRTRYIRDLLDLTYSMAAVVKNRHARPDAPKTINPKEVEWIKIDRGLFHGRRQAWLRSGPLHINVLRISPKHRKVLALDTSRLDEKERTLKSMCKKHNAAAGTSGGFFLYSEPDLNGPCLRGDPVGLIVNEGEVLRPPVFPRSALIIDDRNHVFIKRIGMKGITINAGKATFVARKVNSAIRKSELGVFNRIWGELSPKGGNLHFAVVGRFVTNVSAKPIPIPLNGFVVQIDSGSAPLGLFENLAVGDPVSYRLPVIKGVGEIRTAMAGGPSLLSQGRVQIDFAAEALSEGLPPVTFAEDSSIGESLLPRMAWGITRNMELIALAVDGRNFDRSVGMTLDEVARLMMHLGCTDVLNLDGGSSKRMVVKDKTVDISSVGIETGDSEKAPKRPLSSVLLIK